MNWVKCSDRLPEDRQDVILNLNYHTDMVIATFYKEWCGVEECFHINAANKVAGYQYEPILKTEITHWMRLPAAPKDNP